jgi:protein-S-isoprenylcysteine O-methyltransferase Ste14
MMRAMSARHPSPTVSPWLVLRTTLWSLAFVGTFIVYMPWAWFGAWRAPLTDFGVRALLGLLAIAAGAALVIACIANFARHGRGTPAPMDAPRELVVRGPYRYVRNPMYLGAALAMLGEWLRVPTWPFAGYIALWFAAVSLLVVTYEEPTLRAKFGESYARYTRDVPRFIPRFGRPSPEE